MALKWLWLLYLFWDKRQMRNCNLRCCICHFGQCCCCCWWWWWWWLWCTGGRCVVGGFQQRGSGRRVTTHRARNSAQISSTSLRLQVRTATARRRRRFVYFYHLVSAQIRDSVLLNCLLFIMVSQTSSVLRFLWVQYMNYEFFFSRWRKQVGFCIV